MKDRSNVPRSDGMFPRVVVAQLGSRRHYIVPAVLNRAGALERLYTDVFPTRRVPGRILAYLSERFPKGRIGNLSELRGLLPEPTVTAYVSLGIAYRLLAWLARSELGASCVDLWAGRQLNRLLRQKGFGRANLVYGYSSASLGMFLQARQDGLGCVLEQSMAPMILRDAIVREEHERFAGWARSVPMSAPSFHDVMEAEWDSADAIVGGSSFVVEGLAACGVCRDKCHVVPYAVSPQRFRCSPGPTRSGGPLRVLFLGSVSLRKGIQYLLPAVGQLGRSVELAVVGPVLCTESCLHRALPPTARLVGQVPASEVPDWLDWAQVLVLPSLFEGSAGVTYEALASGVPVVCTPNTGSTVRDGLDGFIVPIRDTEALVDRLHRLAIDRDLLRSMARNALDNARQHTAESYARDLLSIMQGVLDGKRLPTPKETVP